MAIRKWKKVGAPSAASTVHYGKGLVLQQFRNPRTNKVEDFYSYTLRDSVCVMAVTEDPKRVIVTREFMQGADKVIEWIGGGYMNPGEFPVDAARRELREETGYEPTELISLGTELIVPRHCQARVHLFLALECRRVAEQRLDETEDIEIELVSLGKWLDATMDGYIEDQFSCVAALRALRHLGYRPARL